MTLGSFGVTRFIRGAPRGRRVQRGLGSFRSHLWVVWFIRGDSDHIGERLLFVGFIVGLSVH